MFDLSVTKMALIGVVALVVLGPERLARVGRTAGALFNRAQRYVNDLKADVTHELELEALRRMKADFESAACNIETTIHKAVRQEIQLTEAAWQATESAPLDKSSLPVAPGGAGLSDRSAYGGNLSGSSFVSAAGRRRNWRARRPATPVGYKRAIGRRMHAEAGRVAQHKPVILRTPKRFP